MQVCVVSTGGRARPQPGRCDALPACTLQSGMPMPSPPAPHPHRHVYLCAGGPCQALPAQAGSMQRTQRAWHSWGLASPSSPAHASMPCLSTCAPARPCPALPCAPDPPQPVDPEDLTSMTGSLGSLGKSTTLGSRGVASLPISNDSATLSTNRWGAGGERWRVQGVGWHTVQACGCFCCCWLLLLSGPTPVAALTALPVARLRSCSRNSLEAATVAGELGGEWLVDVSQVGGAWGAPTLRSFARSWQRAWGAAQPSVCCPAAPQERLQASTCLCSAFIPNLYLSPPALPPSLPAAAHVCDEPRGPAHGAGGRRPRRGLQGGLALLWLWLAGWQDCITCFFCESAAATAAPHELALWPCERMLQVRRSCAAACAQDVCLCV